MRQPDTTLTVRASRATHEVTYRTDHDELFSETLCGLDLDDAPIVRLPVRFVTCPKCKGHTYT